MSRWFSLLGLCVALAALDSGCCCRKDNQLSPAARIATDYSPINSPCCCMGRDRKAEEAVRLIESGEADRMIETGTAKKTVEESGCGDDGILITRYEIKGYVYKIEVRHRVNPKMDVLAVNMRRMEYGQNGRALFLQNPMEMVDVMRVLKDHSYAAQPEVAYRAWRGIDGKFHPVRVAIGDVPDWADNNAIELYIRTEVWPSEALVLHGLRPDGVRTNGLLYPPDGRWIVVDHGPAVPVARQFYNYKLHKQLELVGIGQLYDINILNAPQ